MRRCLIIVGLVVALVWLAELGAGGRAQPPWNGPRPQVVWPGNPNAPPTKVGQVNIPPAPPGPPAPAEQPPAPVVPPSDRAWPVSGYGETSDTAQQQALENARDLVEQYLHDHYPDLHWTPEVDYLKDIGVIRVAEVRQGTFGDLKGYEAVAQVEVYDPSLRKMQEKVDEVRRRELEPTVTQRHWLVGRILASFIALFLVIFGYIKLEELTRGYYTTLLRLSAGAVVLLAVLGLFLAF